MIKGTYSRFVRTFDYIIGWDIFYSLLRHCINTYMDQTKQFLYNVIFTHHLIAIPAGNWKQNLNINKSKKKKLFSRLIVILQLVISVTDWKLFNKIKEQNNDNNESLNNSLLEVPYWNAPPSTKIKISHSLPGCEIKQGDSKLLCNLQLILSCNAKLGVLCDKKKTTARETLK